MKYLGLIVMNHFICIRDKFHQFYSDEIKIKLCKKCNTDKIVFKTSVNFNNFEFP